MGYQFLLTKKPELAFKSFQEILEVSSKEPKIWIRLAECCIASYIKTTIVSNKPKGTVVKKVIKKDGLKRFLLPTQKNTFKYPENSESEEESPVGLTLEYGAKCIKNALYLTKDRSELSSLRQSSLIISSYIALSLDDPVTAFSNCKEALSGNLSDEYR